MELKLHVPDVPALGYKVLYVEPGAAVAAEKPAATVTQQGANYTLEDADLRVTVDKQTGCITSLSDRRSGFESLAKGGCGNQLQFFKDTPKDYDAWNIDPGTLDVPPMVIEHADSVEQVKTASGAPGVKINVPLAELEVCADAQPRRAMKWTSTTTSTGTSRTFC